MKYEFYTTGRVKWVRPDGDGYIIPDRTLEGFAGINIYFDRGVATRLSIGDRVAVRVRVLDKQLVAMEIV